MNAMIGRILPITGYRTVLAVRAMVPWKETLEVLPAILGGRNLLRIEQFFWSNHMDSNLVDITSRPLLSSLHYNFSAF